MATLDPSTAISSAQRAGLFPVATPTGLPEGWRTLSAQFTRNGATGELRVGYLTPNNGQLQLIESNEDAASLSGREFANQARLTATTTVAGTAWQAYQVRGQERALVLTEPGRSIIVVGSAEAAELEILAVALH